MSRAVPLHVVDGHLRHRAFVSLGIRGTLVNCVCDLNYGILSLHLDRSKGDSVSASSGIGKR